VTQQRSKTLRRIARWQRFLFGMTLCVGVVVGKYLPDKVSIWSVLLSAVASYILADVVWNWLFDRDSGST
jgi:hypothetical protein